MIDLRSVSFSYRSKPLFQDLDWHLEPGTIYGLLGRNGAGKTTLLKLVAGLLFRKEGEIRVLDEDPERRSPALLQDLYFVGEELSIPDMSPKTYEALHSPLYPRFSTDSYYAALREFEVDVDMSMKALSFGQKKKVVLAFALATNTALLILDEPTNALDIPSKGQLRRLLAGAVSEDRIIIVSTHQVRDLEQIIDPITILENGRIVFQQSIEDIDARLGVSVSAQEHPESLYAEKTMGGYASIVAQGGDAGARVDLELLFNAVTAKPDAIQSLVHKETAQ